MRQGVFVRFGAIVWAVLAAAAAPIVARADTVYDNMDPTSPLFQPQLENEEIGDDVTLAGTARVVTNFLISMTSTYANNYSGTFTARFYLPDGPDDGFGNRLPGTKIWEGTTTGLGSEGTRLMAWDVPNVLVPDSFIWTFQMDTTLNPLFEDPDGIGPDLNDNPAVGSSQDLMFINDGTGWGSFNYGGGATDPVANMQAEIVAVVPEPAALGALAIGAVGLIGRRKR